MGYIKSHSKPNELKRTKWRHILWKPSLEWDFFTRVNYFITYYLNFQKKNNNQIDSSWSKSIQYNVPSKWFKFIQMYSIQVDPCQFESIRIDLSDFEPIWVDTSQVESIWFESIQVDLTRFARSKILNWRIQRCS